MLPKRFATALREGVEVLNGALAAEATGGVWTGNAPDFSSLSTDTREIKLGQWFLALKGQRFDAHDHVEQAVALGASALIVAKGVQLSCPQLVVPDTRVALGQLAAAHRAGWSGFSAAVTGSCGKTTTKRLLAAGFRCRGVGVESAKSFNNDIGVPRTLLELRRDHGWLAAEVGMSAPGEIAPLARMVAPDAAILTMVGQAHAGAFDSLDGVRKEKLELLRALGPGGLAVLPEGLPADLPTGVRVVRFGLAGEVVWEAGPWEDQRRTGMIDGHRCRLRLAGRHDVGNAAAAYAVLREFGVSVTDAIQAMESVTPEAMRLTPRQCGQAVVWNDAYNANPESIRSAMAAFADLVEPDRPRVLVLGEVLELGEWSEQAHQELGVSIAQSHAADPFQEILLVGDAFSSVAAHLRADGLPVRHASEALSLQEQFRSMLEYPVAVLMKGSRGTGLERLLPSAGEEPLSGSMG